MSVARTTEILEKSLSYSDSAIVQTSYADDGVVRGVAFVFEKNFTIGVGATLYVLIDYSTYIATDYQAGLVFIYPPSFGTSAGVVTVSVYRDTDYSGGTEFDAVNPNTTSVKTTSGTTFTTGATGTVKGTEVLSYLIGASSTNQSSGGGVQEGLSFFIRENTDKTLVEIVNESGEEIIFHYGQGLFEI